MAGVTNSELCNVVSPNGESSMSDDDSTERSASGPEEWHDSRPRRRRLQEAVLLNLCGILWSADNALLPSVYFELSREFGVGPGALGMLTLLRAVTQSLASFPAGFAADVKPRPNLVCFGCILWGLGIILCGIATTWLQLLAASMVNCIGLGIVQPLLYSLVADTNQPSHRGLAFGTLQFTGNIGVTVGSYFSTILAPLVIMDMAGWSVVFVLCGLVSALCGLAVNFAVSEPRGKFINANATVCSILHKNMPSVCRIMRIPTFLAVIGIGIFGVAPWYSLSYLTVWLELSCFSHADFAWIIAAFNVGSAIACLLGGKLLDLVSRHFPNHGPPWLCIFSVGVGLPLFGYIFIGLPGNTNARMVQEYATVFFLVGSSAAWCGITNNKIFGDIVPQLIYSYVYALDRSIGGTLGAFGTPAVDFLTDKILHYNHTVAVQGDCSPEEARKLGSGVFAVCAVTWGICLCFYTALHYTYPRDRVRKHLFEQQLSLENDSESGEVRL